MMVVICDNYMLKIIRFHLMPASLSAYIVILNANYRRCLND